MSQRQISPLTFFLACIYPIAAIFCVVVAVIGYQSRGLLYMIGFCLAAGSLLLVGIAPFCKSEAAQAIVGLLTIVLVALGCYYFPWTAIGEDPQISHLFTAKGYNVSLKDGEPCTWLVGDDDHDPSYFCDLVIKPIESKVTGSPQPAEVIPGQN